MKPCCLANIQPLKDEIQQLKTKQTKWQNFITELFIDNGLSVVESDRIFESGKTFIEAFTEILEIVRVDSDDAILAENKKLKEQVEAAKQILNEHKVMYLSLDQQLRLRKVLEAKL